MTRKRITTLSMDEALARTGKSRADAPEGPSLGPEFWRDAEVAPPTEPKQQLTLRLDPDIVSFFKRQGRGYQTRINAVLRSFVNAHRQSDDRGPQKRAVGVRPPLSKGAAAPATGRDSAG